MKTLKMWKNRKKQLKVKLKNRIRVTHEFHTKHGQQNKTGNDLYTQKCKISQKQTEQNKKEKFLHLILLNLSYPLKDSQHVPYESQQLQI